MATAGAGHLGAGDGQGCSRVDSTSGSTMEGILAGQTNDEDCGGGLVQQVWTSDRVWMHGQVGGQGGQDSAAEAGL